MFVDVRFQCEILVARALGKESARMGAEPSSRGHELVPHGMPGLVELAEDVCMCEQIGRRSHQLIVSDTGDRACGAELVGGFLHAGGTVCHGRIP